MRSNWLEDTDEFFSPLISVFSFFNWRVIASQSCVSFCCITKWNQLCVYIYNLPLESSSPPPSQPSKSSQSSRLSTLGHTYSSFPLAICVTQSSVYIYVSAIFSVHLTLSFPQSVHKSILYVCGLCLYFCTANKLIGTIFLASICMALIYGICFFCLSQLDVRDSRPRSVKQTWP